jgi:hypothetical protein
LRQGLVSLLTLALAAIFGWVQPAAAAGPPGDRSERVLRVSGRAAPGVFDAQEQTRKMADLQAWLAAEQATEADRTPIVVQVTPEELREIRQPSSEERRLRVGVVKHAGVAVDFAGLGASDVARGSRVLAAGAVRRTDDGGFVWTASVESPGAAGLRIRLERFLLPSGASLYLYNLEGEAFGPYTASGPGGDQDFWTHSVSGERAFLQLRLEGPADIQDLRSIRFVVSEVGHLDPVALGLAVPGPGYQAGFCSYNASCVENGECFGTAQWGAINDVRFGVAHIRFVSGAFLYLCSGGLLNDAGSTGTPYFLTANHCLSKDREASSLEAYFQYRASSCGSTAACSGPGASPRTLGSTVLSTNKTSDYSLLRLSQSAPSGSYFLGWNATPVAFSNGTKLYRLSHPKGAPQAYSQHDVDTGRPTCTSWPRGNWIYSTDRVGATEGGSSGSPVLNGAGEVVGQLSGACGYNVNNVCDSVQNATVDGAFAAYYSQIESYLADSGGGEPPPPPPSGIVLTATGYKVRGLQKADLSWTGASSTVDVYRNGGSIATVTGTTYTDNINARGGGSYNYQVCNQGTTTCSNVVTVSF